MLATDNRRFSYILPIIGVLFRPQIEFARRHVVERLLPTFDKIDNEAELHESQVYNELMSRPGDGADDGSSAAETAAEAGHAYYHDASGFKQGFLNLLFVHLYHLFEQQLATLVRAEQRKQLRDFEYATSIELFQGVYNAFGFDITFFEAWKPVEELKWIANTVKHSEAKDAERLHRKRAELFIYPGTPEELANHPFWNRHPNTELPLVGENFYPQPADYTAKVEAILSFWDEFCAVIRGEKRESRTLGDWVRENREKILAVAEKYGASNVRVFGSVVRGEAGPASDVDLLVKANEKMGLFDLVGLRNELSELLGRKVDLGTDGGIKARHRDRILAEAVPL